MGSARDPDVPDFTMCAAPHCERSKACERHADSGTVPNAHRQSMSNFATGRWFDPYRCMAYRPKARLAEDQDE